MNDSCSNRLKLGTVVRLIGQNRDWVLSIVFGLSFVGVVGLFTTFEFRWWHSLPLLFGTALPPLAYQIYQWQCQSIETCDKLSEDKKAIALKIARGAVTLIILGIFATTYGQVIRDVGSEADESRVTKADFEEFSQELKKSFEVHRREDQELLHELQTGLNSARSAFSDSLAIVGDSLIAEIADKEAVKTQRDAAVENSDMLAETNRRLSDSLATLEEERSQDNQLTGKDHDGYTPTPKDTTSLEGYRLTIDLDLNSTLVQNISLLNSVLDSVDGVLLISLDSTGSQATLSFSPDLVRYIVENRDNHEAPPGFLVEVAARLLDNKDLSADQIASLIKFIIQIRSTLPVL